MSNSRYNSVYQRPPLPVPSDWDGVRRMVQTLESILDDIYRRYGRLALADLNRETSKYITDTRAVAQEAAEGVGTAGTTASAAIIDGAAARAWQSKPDSSATQSDVDTWAAEAYATGVAMELSGADLSAFIREYIAERL